MTRQATQYRAFLHSSDVGRLTIEGETWQGPRYETVGAVKEWACEKV